MIPAVGRLTSPDALNAEWVADTLALPWAAPESFCSGRLSLSMLPGQAQFFSSTSDVD